MKFTKYLALVALTFSTFAFTASSKKFTLENSLLWKIEGKEAKTSYLFGTIHMLPKEKFVLNEKVKTAFSASEKIMLEIDLSDPTALASAMEFMAMPNGQSVTDFITDAEYNLLDSVLMATTGLSLNILKYSKPIVLESMLMQNILGDDAASFEMTLMEMAKTQEKQLLGLETAAQQMQMLDNLPLKEQFTDLMKYVNGEENLEDDFDEMVDFYLEENLNMLDKTMTNYYPDQAWLNNMLYNRNAAWIPKIEKAIKKNSVFIAVGAGHLGNAKGVVNLLREAGYKVTAVH